MRAVFLTQRRFFSKLSNLEHSLIYCMPDIEERAFRIKKRDDLKASGIDPYPSKANRTHTIQECLGSFSDLCENKTGVILVGRIRSIRRHGGSTFLVIEDASEKMQLFIRKDTVGDEAYAIVKDSLDMGDFIEANGHLFLTKTEEKTLHVSSFRLLVKALLPLPEQWHGLSDVEIRFRQRYLDLLVNQDVKQVFLTRSAIIRFIRTFFESNGFVEVETPVLQPLAGGATARPFVTHHNALDQDMFLRIAPELYLKRLVVGGFERVFEFARCFRNEGIDFSHNPEFTILEAYMAYADYNELMRFVEELFVGLVGSLSDTERIVCNDRTVSFRKPFERIDFREALKKYAEADTQNLTDEDLERILAKKGVRMNKNVTRAALLDQLFKKCVIPTIVDPTFIVDHPVELSPLAKRKATDPQTVERFQLVIAGVEVLNAFSELNDPQDQMERFLDQQKNREKGDEEAHQVDLDYVIALEYGLPPTAGLGIGIDRLCALLTNSHSLKEVILFPTLRAK